MHIVTETPSTSSADDRTVQPPRLVAAWVAAPLSWHPSTPIQSITVFSNPVPVTTYACCCLLLLPPAAAVAAAGLVFCRQVSVQLGTASLSVSAAGDVLLAGQLAADIKVEGSTWFCGKWPAGGQLACICTS